MRFVPAGHGARTAHRLERVEEGAAEVAGHALLNRHQLRDGGQRSDFSANCAPFMPRLSYVSPGPGFSRTMPNSRTAPCAWISMILAPADGSRKCAKPAVRSGPSVDTLPNSMPSTRMERVPPPGCSRYDNSAPVWPGSRSASRLEPADDWKLTPPSPNRPSFFPGMDAAVMLHPKARR